MKPKETLWLTDMLIAAQQPLPEDSMHVSLLSTTSASGMLPDIDLAMLQASATDEDKSFWDAFSSTFDEKMGLWHDNTGRLCLPHVALSFLVHEFHGVTHRGRRGVHEMMRSLFCVPKLETTINNILDKCLICAQYNVSKPVAQHQHLPRPITPFSEWQVDFTHMPKRGPFKYLLVCVDKFSKWVEAFPCSRENAKVVTQKLISEIIPRYGIPQSIDSDKETPFTSKVTQQLATELNINWLFHIPYHPQSSGFVERTNRTLKGKIKKALRQHGHKDWVKILPIVLADLRMTPQANLDSLSPYEVVMGRPFPIPWQGGIMGVGIELSNHISEFPAALIQKLNQYWERVTKKHPEIPLEAAHPFQIGDKVLIKDIKPQKDLTDPKYEGPAEVLAVTRTAVLTDLFPQWIHGTRVKPLK